MKNLIVLILLVITIGVKSQDIKGIATYQTKTDFNFNMDGRQITPEAKAQVKAMLRKQFEKTYTLTFNMTESVYVEEQELNKPNQSVDIGTMMGSFRPGKRYKNVKDSIYKEENDFFGKLFLIEDELEKYEWEMTDESKQIGQYVVFKAVATKAVDSLEFTEYRPKRKKRNVLKQDNRFEKKETITNSNTDMSSDTVAMKTQTFKKDTVIKKFTTSDSIVSPLDEIELPKEKKIIAWYTPQIPIQTGPDEYWGLPGLILELKSGKTTILCSKIVLNPEEKIEIEVPSKGKTVTKTEYETIVMDKVKEMQEMYGGQGRRDGMKINFGQ